MDLFWNQADEVEIRDVLSRSHPSLSKLGSSAMAQEFRAALAQELKYFFSSSTSLVCLVLHRKVRWQDPLPNEVII